MSRRSPVARKLAAVREAAIGLRSSPAERRNLALRALRERLRSQRDAILAANARDIKALPRDATPAFRDRLLVDSARLVQIEQSLAQVEALPDPVGECESERRLANGLRVRRLRAPLGVIFLIFESRPNVAVESFSLALKSGNAAILRGGKESHRTTGAFYRLIEQALAEADLPKACLWGITDPDRALVRQLLEASGAIDVVVPRGGEGLIRYVARHSRIPILKNDRGMCHVYVHADADPAMALAILVNAKTQRPGVCNAMETVLVHERIAAACLKDWFRALQPYRLQWYACPRTRRLLGRQPEVRAAGKASWDTEYLDLKMNCRIVGSLDEAIAHIAHHGSGHSESIITADEPTARRFQEQVDAAAVYWNASTRFTDGFELGLGGELGISTQKLHVRGPVGLRELTSLRWVIDGQGQIRAGSASPALPASAHTRPSRRHPSRSNK